MVLLVWPPPDHLWIGRKSRQFPPLSAPASIPAGILALGPSCVSPHAAAQTRIVSVARIRLNSRKSVRPFKGIFCADISEFESHMPSQPVRSLCVPHLASDGVSWDWARACAAGKAMFQMMGVFAEFERAMIAERVRAGLARAKGEGKRLGRPPVAPALKQRILDALAGGLSVRKAAATFRVNPSTVQRIRRPFEA